MEGLERDILREICQGNQRGDQEQPVAKAARELWQAASKMVRGRRTTLVQRQDLCSPERGLVKASGLTMP